MSRDDILNKDGKSETIKIMANEEERKKRREQTRKIIGRVYYSEGKYMMKRIARIMERNEWKKREGKKSIR